MDGFELGGFEGKGVDGFEEHGFEMDGFELHGFEPDNDYFSSHWIHHILSIRTRVDLKLEMMSPTTFLVVSYQSWPDPDSGKIHRYP